MEDYEIIEAGAEPITVAEAKEHIRIPHTRDDAYIAQLIQAAREAAEAFMGRATVLQTIRFYPSCWPASRVIKVPIGQLIALSAVGYYDQDAASQTIATSQFWVDTVTGRGRLKLKQAHTFPIANSDALQPISITYTAGWADSADIPALIKQGIKEHCADLYVNRTPVNIARDGRIAVQIPAPLQRLYGPYRMRA